MPDLRPVILSGGTGTRLWPLSTSDTPKQFAPLFDGSSLFSLTLERVAELGLVLVVTGERFAPLVEAELTHQAVDAEILVEPEGRNTAPAAVAAATISDPEDVLVLVPADHLIVDGARFRDSIRLGADLAADGSIVTFGVAPTRPETGYGYIELGERVGDAHVVARFKEKPDEAEALALVADGRHLWNSGIFVASARTILAHAADLCPEILDVVDRAAPGGGEGVMRLGDVFRTSPAISFDHAIMERTTAAKVLEASFDWSDVGSYVSLLDASHRDDAGNHASGDVTMSQVSGSFVKATSRRVVVAGVNDLVVVETPEVVLVLPLARAQEVRDLQRRVTEG